MFLLDYLNILREYEATQTAYVTAGVQEDYAERVGYIRAIRDLKQELDNLLKAYFPKT